MSTTKKILVIAGGTYVSGAEKVTLDILEGLKEHGHDVHCMVSGWNDGDFIQRIQALGIPYTSIKLGWYYTSKIGWTLDSLVHYPKAIWDFIQLRKKFTADMVYTISFRQIVLLYPFFKNNIVYHIHDPNSHSKQSNYFLNLIDKKVKKYIAVSHFIKKDLEQCGMATNKIEVVHNGINILPVEVKNETSNNITFGIVGQIIHRKGHHIVLQALHLLQQQGVFVQLKIVGKGDTLYEQQLKQQIQDLGLQEQVKWCGFIKDIEVIYEGIDVVLAPTLNTEPFGLMACEANMLGKPVIASNKGGLVEIIEDGVNGFLIDANDSNMLALKMSWFFENKDKIYEFGMNGRQRTIQFFSKQKMLASIQQLIIKYLV